MTACEVEAAAARQTLMRMGLHPTTTRMALPPPLTDLRRPLITDRTHMLTHIIRRTMVVIRRIMVVRP